MTFQAPVMLRPFKGSCRPNNRKGVRRWQTGLCLGRSALKRVSGGNTLLLVSLIHVMKLFSKRNIKQGVVYLFNIYNVLINLQCFSPLPPGAQMTK